MSGILPRHGFSLFLQLVMAYVASRVLPKNNQPSVSYSQIRDAIHKQLEVHISSEIILNLIGLSCETETFLRHKRGTRRSSGAFAPTF